MSAPVPKWAVEAVSRICEFLDAKSVLIHAHHEKHLARLIAEAQAKADGWLPIESAPKDGTWIVLWREPSDSPHAVIWEPMIIARWDGDEERWIWPTETFEIFTDRGRNHAEWLLKDDCYCADFTDFEKWRPLPAPPASGKEGM